MARSQPNQMLRGRVELAIRLMAPMLDVLLVTGELASRVLTSGERDQRPPRLASQGEHAPRGLPPRGGRAARS
jgi:hypothetical protein